MKRRNFLAGLLILPALVKSFSNILPRARGNIIKLPSEPTYQHAYGERLISIDAGIRINRMPAYSDMDCPPGQNAYLSIQMIR